MRHLPVSLCFLLVCHSRYFSTQTSYFWRQSFRVFSISGMSQNQFFSLPSERPSWDCWRLALGWSWAQFLEQATSTCWRTHESEIFGREVFLRVDRPLLTYCIEESAASSNGIYFQFSSLRYFGGYSLLMPWQSIVKKVLSFCAKEIISCSESRCESVSFDGPMIGHNSSKFCCPATAQPFLGKNVERFFFPTCPDSSFAHFQFKER